MSNEAKAYQNPGTPEEVSRRAFLARATIFTGGIIGLGLTIPLVATLVPKPELIDANKGFSPLNKSEFTELERTLDKPVKIFFNKRVVDGYYETDAEYYVWGIKLSPTEMDRLRQERPELFNPETRGDIDYPIGTMGFVMFSSLCPHLNCKFDWDDGARNFICPCHGSVFNKYGKHLQDISGRFIGPAPRGLDPLPFKEQNGLAEVEWIKFAANTPSIVRVSYW
ncbi:MAG TPA: Rieske 2Fe-2S domain-containing protein [Candidatus Eremiobacteraceae bacterium]|nr:Rieske 2Fe-2S domain-containing protein [Candidatus Eremiobacteraceae bacterium]